MTGGDLFGEEQDGPDVPKPAGPIFAPINESSWFEKMLCRVFGHRFYFDTDNAAGPATCKRCGEIHLAIKLYEQRKFTIKAVDRASDPLFCLVADSIQRRGDGIEWPIQPERCSEQEFRRQYLGDFNPTGEAWPHQPAEKRWPWPDGVTCKARDWGW